MGADMRLLGGAPCWFDNLTASLYGDRTRSVDGKKRCTWCKSLRFAQLTFARRQDYRLGTRVSSLGHLSWKRKSLSAEFFEFLDTVREGCSWHPNID